MALYDVIQDYYIPGREKSLVSKSILHHVLFVAFQVYTAMYSYNEIWLCTLLSICHRGKTLHSWQQGIVCFFDISCITSIGITPLNMSNYFRNIQILTAHEEWWETIVPNSRPRLRPR